MFQSLFQIYKLLCENNTCIYNDYKNICENYLNLQNDLKQKESNICKQKIQNKLLMQQLKSLNKEIDYLLYKYHKIDIKHHKNVLHDKDDFEII